MKRADVFSRDSYRCVYCGQQFDVADLTVDHVQPRMRGGDHSDGNLVTACQRCNAAKGQRRLADFLADEPDARENFERYARWVWPRILRQM